MLVKPPSARMLDMATLIPPPRKFKRNGQLKNPASPMYRFSKAARNPAIEVRILFPHELDDAHESILEAVKEFETRLYALDVKLDIAGYRVVEKDGDVEVRL